MRHSGQYVATDVATDCGAPTASGAAGIVFAVTLGLIPRETVTVQASSGAPASEPLYLSFGVGALAIGGLVLLALAGVIAVMAYWPSDFS